MTKPLFSIVIANYNFGRFLEDAIQSVIAQGMGDQVELIICDAASTDNSVEVIKKYAHGLPPNTLRSEWNDLTLDAKSCYSNLIAWWCSEKDGGQSAAFNKGFAHARGRFLTWLNADDLLLPGSLRNIADAIHDNPTCQWFVGSSIWCDADLFVKRIFCAHNFSSRRVHERNLSCYGPSSFFTKDILVKAGGIDESLHYVMDTDLWYRFVLKLKERFITIKKPVWVFREHDASKMSGPVLEPNSEESIRKRKALHREREILAQRYGHANALFRFTRVFPVSILDAIRVKIMMLRFKGRHLNQMFGTMISRPRLLLSNALPEYVKGLSLSGAVVHYVDNWTRGSMGFVEGACPINPNVANDVQGLSDYVYQQGISVLYAQGGSSLRVYKGLRKRIRLHSFRRVMLLATCHNSYVWDSRLKSFLMMFYAALFADGFVFISNKHKKQWGWLLRLVGCRCYHVPNPTDYNRSQIHGTNYDVDTIRSFIVGMIASIVRSKRQDLVVRAVCHLLEGGEKIRCVICGDFKDEAYVNEMKAYIDERGYNDSFEWRGRIEPAQVPTVLNELDVFVCPSDHELMPFSILEAMAAGVPVIAHNVGGISEEIQDGKTGCLVSTDNYMDYVNAIARLMKDGLGERLGNAARTRVIEQFSMPVYAKRMKDVLGQYLAR